MAISQNQRLRKAAAKAAKRKAVVAEKRERERRELRISKPRHIDLAASPIVACTVTETLESGGVGIVLLARKLTLGRYAVAEFLVDVWCQGLRAVDFQVEDADDYDPDENEDDSYGPRVAIDPARAHRLLRDAAAYGTANGFPPPPDLADVLHMLSDVPPDGAAFVFGRDGKPHFKPDIFDMPEDIDYALETLTDIFGPDGFTHEPPPEREDDIEYEDEPETTPGRGPRAPS